MCLSVAGWQVSEAVPTSAVSVLAARCRVSPTSLCHSWMSRRVQKYPQTQLASMVMPFADCARSPTALSIKSHRGGIKARSYRPATGRIGALDENDLNVCSAPMSDDFRGDSIMATQVKRDDSPNQPSQLVEMAWDPITRIVG